MKRSINKKNILIVSECYFSGIATRESIESIRCSGRAENTGILHLTDSVVNPGKNPAVKWDVIVCYLSLYCSGLLSELIRMTKKTAAAERPMIIFCGDEQLIRMSQDLFRRLGIQSQAAMADRSYQELSCSLKNIITHSGQRCPDISVKTLTRREKQVFACLLEGVSSERVSRRMGLSVKTIAGHKVSALNKLSVRNFNKYVITFGNKFIGLC